MSPASPPPVPVPIARGTRGAVVAPHHLATQAGLGVLRAGGSAVDAAIATNAALAVVMPSACGLGGDAFWLIRDERTGDLVGLNGSGRSAATASADGILAAGYETMPRRGPLSITVPGAVRSWADAHARFGRLGLADVLAPAIELAAGGFAASDGYATAVERAWAIAADHLDATARGGFGASFRLRDRPWRAGEIVRRPALATTLGRLADVGLDDLYDGELAERQARFLESSGSPLRLADLEAHRSTWTEPIMTSYRGTAVATHPPNSSGVVALEILNVLDVFAPPRPGETADARWIHLAIEAAKLAMADRDAELTDPETRAIPLERLLSRAHAETLAGSIDPRRARRPGLSSAPIGGGTVALATVDAEGNAVSLIESNYMGFGSLVADPGTGIHYQNRGAYFSVDAGHPNVLAPAKRPLHTLLPWMLFRDAGTGARPWVVGGSMGGDAQPQICAEVVSALVDRGLDIRSAVAGPRWFVEPADHFAPPVEVRIEPRFGPDLVPQLERLGHPVTPTAPFDSLLGHCHLVELVDGGPAAGGSLAGATDPRSEGLPAVW